MSKIVIEGQIRPEQVDVEDGGMAMIGQPDEESLHPFFVKLQSWDETKQHTTFKNFIGKRVRVTVEIIDDASPQS